MQTPVTTGTWEINQIPLVNFKCLSTGFPYLDKILGHSEARNEYGLPLGAISIWSGSKGVGKTRTLSSISNLMCQMNTRLLYFQLEISPQQFRTHLQKIVHAPPNTFIISSYNTRNEMISAMQFIKPQLVIIDSINMMEGYGSAKECKIIFERFRDITAQLNCNILCVAHLNKDGSTKGDSTVEHLGDMVCSLTKEVPPKRYKGEVPDLTGIFRLLVKKNRFGISDQSALFHHIDSGVEFLGCSLPEWLNKARGNPMGYVSSVPRIKGFWQKAYEFFGLTPKIG